MATAAEISALYNKYLGRDPLQSGIDAWLATGQSIEQIEQGVANSPEAAVYKTFNATVGRDPTMEERDFFVNVSPSSPEVLEEVLSNTKEAQEFASNNDAITEALTSLANSPDTRGLDLQGMFSANKPDPVVQGQNDLDTLINQIFGGGFGGFAVDGLHGGIDPVIIANRIKPYLEGLISILNGSEYINEDGFITDPELLKELGDWASKVAQGVVGDGDLSSISSNYPLLEDLPGWGGYYSSITGNEFSGDTEDTEDKDPRLIEAIQTYGQEAVDDAQAKIKELETIIGKAVDDPFGTLEGIITSTASGTRSCQESNPSDWIRNCVTVGVTLPIPLPLPGPLGNIFKGATVGEIEQAIKDAGSTIGEVIRGETSVEEVLDDLGDWIGEKVQGVLGDDEKGTITIESVLGAIGGFLPNVAAGVIWSTFQNKIENKIGLPILLTTEDGTEDSRCRDAEGNLTPWGERNPASCGQPVTFEESDLFGTGGLDSTVECDEGTADAKGNCVCPDGTLEDRNGKCADDVVDPEVDPNGSGPDAEEICQEKGLTYDSNPNNPDRDNDGCVSTVISDPKCDDPNAQNYNELGDCGECNAGYSRKPGQTLCTKDDDTGGGGEDQCTGGKVRVNGECVCPSGTTEVNGQCVSGPRDTSTKVYKSAYCKTRGPEGGTLVTTYTDDTQEESFSEVCKASAGDTTTGGGGYKCDDPNATTREDGSCGPCKAGYVYDGAVERCVQSTAPDPCLDAAYAEANPTICGTAPECNDCTCAEYAAANPEECGTTPPPSTSSGGGGGGGGGAGGMFTGTVSGISYAPQALPGIQSPPPVNAMASIEGLIGRMLTGNIS